MRVSDGNDWDWRVICENWQLSTQYVDNNVEGKRTYWYKVLDQTSGLDSNLMSITTAATASFYKYDKPSSWALDQISLAAENELITQELVYDFRAGTTRAEYCRAVINFLNKWYDVWMPGWAQENGIEVRGFADTMDYDICLARALGIVNGTDKNRNLFSPDLPLTREQAAVMLRNTLEYIGIPTTKEYPFGWADMPSVSNWAVDAVDSMGLCGIMSGTSGSSKIFSPKSAYTHEQSILTFVRLYEYARIELNDM